VLLAVGILAVHWWHAVVFGVLPACVFLVLVAFIAGSAKQAQRKSGPDPLAEALRQFDIDGRRKP
jgi:hypothetical protein